MNFEDIKQLTNKSELTIDEVKIVLNYIVNNIISIKITKKDDITFIERVLSAHKKMLQFFSLCAIINKNGKGEILWQEERVELARFWR